MVLCEMGSLYDSIRKDEKKESSSKNETILSKEDYSYRWVDGWEERVDLTRVGVSGMCCPEIVDLPGMAVLKGCKLQPVYEDHKHGKQLGYVSCGPLCYINHFERCPVRRRAK